MTPPGCALLAASCVMLASAAAGAQEPAADHGAWEALLRRSVRDGRVDYAGLKADPKPLERSLFALRYAETSQLAAPNDQLAFWVNAYNACVVKHVVDHYPITTIKDVPGFADTVTCEVDRKAMTLAQLHAAARHLGDWRVHMALANGTVSGPVLRAEAYTPDRVEGQLNEQVHRFLTDPVRGLRLDAQGHLLWVSRLFAWYTPDFLRAGPLTSESLLLVLRRHVDPSVLEQAGRNPLALNYLDYDWSLNDQGAGSR